MNRFSIRYPIVGIAVSISSFLLTLVFLLLRNPAPLWSATDTSAPDAPGSISGYVRDAQGQPIEGITVDLYFPSFDYPQRSATTDSSGAYKFQIVGPGEYRIGFRDWSLRYLPKFYNDAQLLESATNVLVIGSAVENISATLIKSSTITGTISMSGSFSTALAGVSVVAYKWTDSPLPHWQQSLDTQPLFETGAYTISGLYSGIYRICASVYLYSYEQYLVDCFGNGSHIESAQDVVLGEESVVGGINIIMNDGSDYATITGRVTDQLGKPISDTHVYISQTGLPGGEIGYGYSAFTDINGFYKVDTLVSEVVTYAVSFHTSSGAYVYEYYDNALSIAQAHLITPKSREVISNINAILEPAAQITGVVTLQGEAPSQEGYVYALRKIGEEWQTVADGHIATGSGQYSIGALPGGIYRICGYYWLGNESIGNCLGGKVSISATDVIVGVGETRANVNFDVRTNAYEGGISGRVTNNEVPLMGIRVDLQIDGYTTCDNWDKRNNYNHELRAFGSSDQVNAIYTFTDSQGNYSFQGLYGGHFKVIFSDPQGYYATEYFQESSVPYDSTGIYLNCEEQLHNINRTLTQAGAIAGNVRLATTRPISHAIVTLYRNDTGFWQPIPLTFYTDEFGNYDAKGLLPGTYRLYFYANEQLFPFLYPGGEVYGILNSDRIEDAADVVVISGETRSGINIILGPDGIVWLPLVSRE